MRPAVLLAAIVAACTVARGAPTPADRPTLSLMLAAGDTARGYFTYTAGARATGALITVQAASFPATATWSGLPTAAVSAAAGSFSFVATSAAADSADLTPCVTWTNASGSSPQVCGIARRWRRLPGTGTINWDSLKVSVKPDSATFAVGSSRVYCGFKTFGDGHVALRTVDRPACDSIYQRSFSTLARAVTAAEQAHEDSTCYTWSSSNPVAVTMQVTGCSAAATAEGLQVTMQDALPLFRYASMCCDGPIGTVDQHGLLTCHRDGPVLVTATVEGVSGSQVVMCHGPYRLDWIASR